MAVYYRIDGNTKYYTNEQKTGYSTWRPDEWHGAKYYVIELYQDKFVLPSICRSLFREALNETFNDVDKGDTQYLNDTSSMFADASNLKSINLRGGDDADIIKSSYMFGGCSSLTTLDFTGGTLRVNQDASMMFKNCTSLQTVIFPDFNMTRVTNVREMFSGCTNLERLLTKEGTNGATQYTKLSESYSSSMFYQCSKLPAFKAGGLNYLHANNTKSDGYFGICRNDWQRYTVYIKV